MVPAWHIPGALSFRSALRQAAGSEWKPADVRPDDIAFLQYTGGTTGVPKGAMLSHGNMVANLQQAHAWLKSFLEEGRETIITPLPLYHIFALTANCLVFLKIGATNVLITNPRDIPGLVKELARHPFTVITGVNTLYNALLNNPDFAKLDFSRLKLCLGGGTAIREVGGGTVEAGHRETADRSLRSDGNLAGRDGQSAKSARVQRLHRPSPAVDRDRNPRRQTARPSGRRGRRALRARSPGDEGLLATSRRDRRGHDGRRISAHRRHRDRRRGRLRAHHRSQKGYDLGFGLQGVSATSSKRWRTLHPGVLEAGAVGVPDARSGEAVKLVVVRKDPALTSDDLLAFCRKNLTGYKVPRHIEFRENLPKTPIGKILRRALRDPDVPTRNNRVEEKRPLPTPKRLSA